MIGTGIEKLKLITLEEPNSVHAEMYRSIRTNIEYSSIDKQLKVINVTSTFANETKTTTIANMAIMAANKHKKVLLIDLDLRSPSVHRAFNVKNTIGITDLLIDFLKNKDNIDLSKYTQEIIHENITNQLHIISAGTEVINPSEILSSKKIRELIDYLKQYYDEIYLDSAPGGIVTDGIITSSIADGTVYIVESGKTKIDIAQKTIENLRSLKVNLVGVILAKVPNKLRDFGYYGNYGTQSENKNRIKIDVE